jgi:hypothetical protein
MLTITESAKKWSVETDSKWALGETNTVMYEQSK